MNPNNQRPSNMKIAEILTIGNEVLDGRVVDTNRVYIGQHLKERGWEVRFAQSVDDDLNRIADALSLAASRSDLIIATGGLGPTDDDITAEAAAKFLKRPLLLCEQVRDRLIERLRERGREVNDAQLKQAYFPEGSKILANPNGSAPGFACEQVSGETKRYFYFFPGVPKEMHPMFQDSVISLAAPKKFTTHTWSTIFTGEGDLQQLLRSVNPRPFKFGFRTKFPENFVSLLGSLDSESLQNKFSEVVQQMDSLLGPLSYAKGKEIGFEQSLLNILDNRKARLLLVESCTGGLMASSLTDCAGASRTFWGSHVTYANEEKVRFGVDPKLIEQFGSVSAECALGMAKAGIGHLQADTISPADTRLLLCLSCTGIAGPGGATVTKPVGLIHFGLAIVDVLTNKSSFLTENLYLPQHFDRIPMKTLMAKRGFDFLRRNLLHSTIG